MRLGAIYGKKTTTFFILGLFYPKWLTNVAMLTVETTIVYAEYASHMIYFNFLRYKLKYFCHFWKMSEKIQLVQISSCHTLETVKLLVIILTSIIVYVKDM